MNLALKVHPPIQLIICASLMYSLAKYFPQYHFDFSFNLHFTTVLIIVAGIIGTLALYDFRKHKTTFHPHTPEKTSTVVDSGIYAYSRNPMYLALVLVLFALAFYLKNILCFTIIPLFIWYITRYQIKPEEVILERIFQDSYQAYSQKVRRWL
mgnify:CR=1 FL=1